MTYCLALRLDEGLVLAADTRTNAGVDDVSTYRKQHVFRPGADRIFVLQSAGNLATTHEVLDRIAHDLEAPGDHPSLATVGRTFEAATYVAGLAQEVASRHEPVLGPAARATFILGGRIGDAPADILLVYPEGNCIRASDERPFLQIGESKYGKFLLELAVHAHVGLAEATKIALSSLVSTARANLSVGPPYDLAILPTGGHDLIERRVDEGSDYLDQLQQVWVRHLVAAIGELPPLPAG